MHVGRRGQSTSDAHAGKTPTELPGLVTLGSKHDYVVPGR